MYSLGNGLRSEVYYHANPLQPFATIAKAVNFAAKTIILSVHGCSAGCPWRNHLSFLSRHRWERIVPAASRSEKNSRPPEPCSLLHTPAVDFSIR
jgi:hypothetical protein